MLRVVSPGLLSTVQDRGRPGLASMGVARGGACDPLALAAANLLAGNAADTPALEMSLLGPELEVVDDCVVGLAGADMDARVPENGRGLVAVGSHEIRAGTHLVFGPAVDGARAYLALAGGIDAPRVLGSASTALVGGFGGIDGRPLAVGDCLRESRQGDRAGAGRAWPGPGPSSGVGAANGPRTVRILPGPHLGRFPPGAMGRLLDTDWGVTSQADRAGVRLSGPELLAPGSHELVSTGMVWGAVQVPVGGRPIALLADHPTVGGYPVIAVVVTADLPVLGQLRPADVVRFVLVDQDEARALLMGAERDLAAAAAALVQAADASSALPLLPEPRSSTRHD